MSRRKVNLDCAFKEFAFCPHCNEDWSYGFTSEKRLKGFVNARCDDAIICAGCREVVTTNVLTRQLVC